MTEMNSSRTVLVSNVNQMREILAAYDAQHNTVPDTPSSS